MSVPLLYNRLALSACLQSLYYSGMNQRKNEISDAAIETCVWLSCHPTYREWLAKSCGLLWVKGKPGAGKSTLMRHVIRIAEEQSRQNKQVIASYFFHGRGAGLQKNAAGLFRSLLHQILQSVPHLLQVFETYFTRRCDTEGPFGQKWDWHEKDLVNFFQTEIVEVARTLSVRIYIDALDESGEQSANDVVELFRCVVAKATSLKASISICFSCRHYPFVSLETGSDISVENENDRDIRKYISDSIGVVIRERAKANKILNQVTQKASGNFQWVVLVLPGILDLYRKGRPKAITKHIEALPSELHELYSGLLQDINDDDRQQSIQLMQWLCFAFRPLSLAELRYAMILGVDESYQTIKEFEKAEEFAETDDEMERRVQNLSRGLAEITEYEGRRIAQFVHESVKDYLVQSGLKALDDQTYESIVGRAHSRLSKSCLKYFTMNNISRPFPTLPYSSGNLPKEVSYKNILDSEYPFLNYATDFWIAHAQIVEEESTHQECLQYFLRPPCNIFSTWICLFNRGHPLSWVLPHPTQGMTPLHIASKYGLLSILKEILNSQKAHMNSEDDAGRTALSHAAKEGQENIVRLLLEHDTINVNSKDHDGNTPLMLAAEVNSESVVKLLLDRDDIEVNSKEISMG